jgi:RHS repeat-associated protein
VLYPLTDQQNTVRDLVDTSRTVVNHLTYDSFGKVTAETNAAVDYLFGYAGMERDEALHLNRADHRYYDAGIQRWLSEDPIGFASGDHNLYRYVGNGPTNATDPSGFSAWTDYWSNVGSTAKGYFWTCPFREPFNYPQVCHRRDSSLGLSCCRAWALPADSMSREDHSHGWLGRTRDGSMSVSGRAFKKAIWRTACSAARQDWIGATRSLPRLGGHQSGVSVLRNR